MNYLRQEKYLRDHGAHRRLALLVNPLMGDIAPGRSRPLARLEPDLLESPVRFSATRAQYRFLDIRQFRCHSFQISRTFPFCGTGK
jgi:hypothetical protein